MPYWMEVHCAKKIGSCYSNQQHNVPMVLTRNASMAAMSEAAIHLSKEAKQLGWTNKDNDWVCPECKDK